MSPTSIALMGAFLLLSSGCLGRATGEEQTATDAGPMDASLRSADADGGTDGGVDAGRAGKTCAQRVVCDDFEANEAGAPPAGWTLEVFPESAGTLSVDTTRAFSGTKAIRTTATSATRTTTQMLKCLVPTYALSAFYGRMRLWTNDVPRNVGHWNFVGGAGFARDGGRSGNDWLMYNFGGGGSNLSAFVLNPKQDCCMPCGNQAGVRTLPINRWVCVEWQFDTVKHEMRLWIDSELIEELTVLSPTTTGSCIGQTFFGPDVFERAQVGWENSRGRDAGVLETWIDDVSIDTERIGCSSSP